MKRDFSQKFGALLKLLRKERGMSQKQLAAQAGVTYIYIGKLEKGRSDPTLSVLKRLATGFNLPFSEFARQIEHAIQKNS